MDDDVGFEAMAEARLKAHEAVAQTGTPVMLAMTRSLLWQVGQELVQREERRDERLRLAEAERQQDTPDRDYADRAGRGADATPALTRHTVRMLAKANQAAGRDVCGASDRQLRRAYMEYPGEQRQPRG